MNETVFLMSAAGIITLVGVMGYVRRIAVALEQILHYRRLGDAPRRDGW